MLWCFTMDLGKASSELQSTLEERLRTEQADVSYPSDRTTRRELRHVGAFCLDKLWVRAGLAPRWPDCLRRVANKIWQEELQERALRHEAVNVLPFLRERGGEGTQPECRTCSRVSRASPSQRTVSHSI